MASKALAVVSKGTSAVQYVDPAKVNYAVASRWLAQQATGGSNRMFAGRQLRFDGKKGGYTEYVNKQDKKIKNPVFVLNVPNTYAAWQVWPDKEAPSYPHVIAPYQSEDAALPSRAQAGPYDTKFNKLKKEDEDIYNEAVILILRDPDTEQIYHWVGVKSQRNAMVEFLQENNDEFVRRKGKLPVVELSNEEIELKDGGSYEKPVITIVDWVKPTAMDNPQGLAASVASEAGDEDEDEEPVKTTVKSRSSKPASSAKSKSRDEDDEDDEEEEDDDAPSTKAAAKKRAAQQAAAKKKYADEDEEDDEDEDDEDEDERPAKKSAKSKVVVASKRKVAAVEDDEDDEDEEEDEPAPRKRRSGR